MKTRAHLGIWAVVLVVLAVVLVMAGLTRGGGGGDESTARSDPSAGTEEDARSTGIDLARHERGDPLAVGDEDAPVVLVEYADFRCPFCGIWARDTKPQLMKYVEDGTLRIEWHDLPVFGEQSMQAAVAGRAAAEQDRFWEFYEAAYADAPERGHQDLSRTRLVALAKEAGVPDMTQFTSDLDSKQLRRQVQTDAKKAWKIGATATPFFMVNDEPIMGAQPAHVFKEAIERQAKKSAGTSKGQR